MTIALDATPLSLSTGGIPRYTLELARALAIEFPQDDYWLLSDQKFSRPVSLPENLHCGERPRHWVDRRWWSWGLERQMARLGVDLFHGTDFAVPFFSGRPSVMTLHDLSMWLDPVWHEGSRVRWRAPLLLRFGRAAMVVTPSEPVRRAAIERFRLHPDRVVTVPLAAAATFRPVPVPKPERPYFLFVGTLEPRKNIGRLIDAWREVRRRYNVDLVLAGRARADFTAPAEETGLRMLGAVPDEDLPGWYSGALACVYPSLYEGFGLPVLEAMQCGALAIVSRDAAIAEVAGDAAVAVEATDTKALAEAMAAVARSPEGFAELRRQGLARARLFSWARTARGTREVYEAARGVFRRG